MFKSGYAQRCWSYLLAKYFEILNSRLTLMKDRQLERKRFQSLHVKIPTPQMFINFGIYLFSKDSLGEQSNWKCVHLAPSLWQWHAVWLRAVCERGPYWGKKLFNVEWARLKILVLNMGALSNHCSEFGSLTTSWGLKWHHVQHLICISSSSWWM